MNDALLSRMAGWAAVAALAELLLLRIATRTFIHIPGVDLLAGPLSVVSEMGRLAFYLTVVLVTALGGGLVLAMVRAPNPTTLLLSGAMAVAFLSAGGAAAGAVSFPVSGWLGLAAVGLASLGAVRAGWRSVPLLLWASAIGVLASGVLLQGAAGGGLEGDQVGGLVLAGDLIGLVAAVTLPLLLGRRPSRPAVVGGVVAGGVVAAVFWSAPSTATVLALWSVGVPAGLPPVMYGLGAAGAVTTIWAALATDRRVLAAAVMLLSAGGIGLISTYQTALVVSGLVLATVDLLWPSVFAHRLRAIARKRCAKNSDSGGSAALVVPRLGQSGEQVLVELEPDRVVGVDAVGDETPISS